MSIKTNQFVHFFIRIYKHLTADNLNFFLQIKKTQSINTKV